MNIVSDATPDNVGTQTAPHVCSITMAVWHNVTDPSFPPSTKMGKIQNLFPFHLLEMNECTI